MQQNTSNSIDASQENSYNSNTKSTATCIGVEDSAATTDVKSCDNLQESGDNTPNGPIVAPVADSSLVLSETNTNQINGGHKKNSVVGHPPSPDQRGVFISGYDFQVSRVCLIFFIYKI